MHNTYFKSSNRKNPSNLPGMIATFFIFSYILIIKSQEKTKHCGSEPESATFIKYNNGTHISSEYFPSN